jgi:hypothetical protein
MQFLNLASTSSPMYLIFWIVLLSLIPVLLSKKVADHPLVPDVSDFSNFMYLDKDAIGSGKYFKSFCEKDVLHFFHWNLPNDHFRGFLILSGELF